MTAQLTNNNTQQRTHLFHNTIDRLNSKNNVITDGYRLIPRASPTILKPIFNK